MKSPNKSQTAAKDKAEIARIRKLMVKELASREGQANGQKTILRFIDEVKHIEKLDKVLNGAVVALYRATPWELSLTSLERYLKGRQAQLCYPKITHMSQGEMKFYLVEDPATYAWKKNKYGIEEPSDGLTAVPPELIKIIIVPGLAYGRMCERIGRGAGHYDRYLPHCSQALKIALAFDFQLLNKIPSQAWDIPMDWILTESHEVRSSVFEAFLAE